MAPAQRRYEGRASQNTDSPYRVPWRGGRGLKGPATNYELRDSSFESKPFWSEVFDSELLDSERFDSELLDSEFLDSEFFDSEPFWPFDLAEVDEASLESPLDPESEPFLDRESVA